jgi:hypothetical protein
VFGAACEKLFVSINAWFVKISGWCSSPDRMLQTRAIAHWKMNGCVSQNALLFCFNASIASCFYPQLSVYALAASLLAGWSEFRLPIYADVLSVFFGSN